MIHRLVGEVRRRPAPLPRKIVGKGSHQSSKDTPLSP